MGGLVDSFKQAVAQRGAVVVAGLLSAAWLGMVGLFWLVSPVSGQPISLLSRLMSAVGILLPVALIWMAAGVAQALAELRDEALRLRAEMERMRLAGQAPQATVRRAAALPEGGVLVDPAVAGASAPAQAARAAVTDAATARPAAPARPRATATAATQSPISAPTPAPTSAQASLALDLPGDGAPGLPVDTLIRALNFPESADDAQGIAALRAALADPTGARLVRAAQDVLTLLARDGIFMDDLTSDRARPELWRRFANGERGREISALGGVRDRTTLAIVQGLLRSDTIFRDAAHHFLRQFDRALALVEPAADDAQIVGLSGTRTARAFMLLGRAAGTFD